MLWRLAAAEWRRGKGETNRQAMRMRVASGVAPGILAYAGDDPVGWISIAPREEFPRMLKSRIVAPLDDQPVWAVTCFFIHSGFRRRGVATSLLMAACAFAARNGARIIEGYPIDPRGERYANAFAWTGIMRVFELAGFEEVARRSDKRPVMRRTLQG